jgi:hypothetical protein
MMYAETMSKLLHVLAELRARGLTDLNPVERRTKVSVPLAAALNNIHEDTFRNEYGHLIKQVSRRRQAVDLGDALDLPPPKEAAE